MKNLTKQLALVLAFALIMGFALAACSDSGGNNSGGSSSNPSPSQDPAPEPSAPPQDPDPGNGGDDPGNGGGDVVVQNNRPYAKDYTLDFGDGIRIELGVTTLQDLYDFGFVFNDINRSPDYDILTDYGPGGEMFLETEEEFIKIDVFLEDVHAPGAWPRPLDASEDKMVVCEYWAISMYAAGAVVGERLVIGQSALEDAMAAYSHFELSGGDGQKKALQHTESDGTRVQFWFSSFYGSDEELLDSVRILSPHR